MPKSKTVFFCSNCGASSPKWQGKCPSCNEWNTYVQEVVQKGKQQSATRPWSDTQKRTAIRITDVSAQTEDRLHTKDDELDRVLGGGMVFGSVVLVGGQPGIGKSTLLLQMALQYQLKTLYVSGEESESQIAMRARRIGTDNPSCFLLSETDVHQILSQAATLAPQVLIVDSIQTLSSPLIDSTPGSVSQIRECAGELMRFAKERQVAVFIIGHITKDGAIAGPKLLEHMVDAVLQFEGDQNHVYRVLRTTKNRFGSTDEIGIYEMRPDGLRQVQNPSELLLSQSEESLSGSAVASTLEGIRPMLIETQALVSRAVFGTPQRSATGFDTRRLHMLLAVLEKRCGLPFAMNDVFLNLAGGIRIADPAIDLAIVSALISSLQDIPVDKQSCFAGEVGLSGEIRAINRIEQRIQEADRMGFERIFVSKYNLKGIDTSTYRIHIVPITRLEGLLESLFA